MFTSPKYRYNVQTAIHKQLLYIQCRLSFVSFALSYNIKGYPYYSMLQINPLLYLRNAITTHRHKYIDVLRDRWVIYDRGIMSPWQHIPLIS